MRQVRLKPNYRDAYLNRKTHFQTEERPCREKHDDSSADMGSILVLSISLSQNVTAVMLLEAPNEVKNQSLVFRTNPCGFSVKGSTGAGDRRAKHQTTLKARKRESLCFAQHWIYLELYSDGKWCSAEYL